MGILAACRSGESVITPKDPTATTMRPWFFTLKSSIQLADFNGDVQTHMFFDGNPQLKEGLINFLPLAIAGSSMAYALDIPSGQRYVSSFPCSQPDVRGKGSVTPSTPSYTLGIVPRILDQRRRPQNILVFGGEGRFKTDVPELYRVRIVGGMVASECAAGDCDLSNTWNSSLLLVAVDTLDPLYREVSSALELREKLAAEGINLENEYANLQGHLLQGERPWPATRLGKILERDEVMDFFSKRSIVFTGKELLSLRGTCGKLYGTAWKDAGKKNLSDMPAETVEQMRARALFLRDARSKGHPALFRDRLGQFLAKRANEYALCAELVYPGNPNRRPDKFWFNTWLGQFVNMHALGFFYDCNSSSWSAQNIGKEQALKHLEEDLLSCTEKALDKAFTSLPLFLASLSQVYGQSWRFIDWDTGVYGSHAKIYHWVMMPTRAFSCNDDANSKLRAMRPIQPEQGTWSSRRGVDNKKNNVIY